MVSAPAEPAQAVIEDVDVPPPPGIEPQQVSPRGGDDLTKANLPLAAVLEHLPRPDFLATPAALPDEADAEHAAAAEAEHGEDDGQELGNASAGRTEPPLAAQRFYLAGRQSWLESKTFDAITQLEAAHQLAPNNAAINRLLGKVHAGSNRVQAARYLAAAVRQDPTDVESLFLLGRDAVRQGRWNDAIVALAQVLAEDVGRSDVDQSIGPLAQFMLAGALDRAGHDRAAIEQYQAFVSSPRAIYRPTRLARHLLLFRRQTGRAWQHLGDAHHRLGEPAEALGCYEQAGEHGVNDRPALAARFAYTYLRLGRSEAAQRFVVDQLRQTQASEQSFALVEYVRQHSPDAASMSEHLRQTYEASGRQADMAVSVAALLNEAEARSLLREHLTAKPADGAVFEHLMRRLLRPMQADTEVPAGDDEASRAAEALRVTVEVIEALPAAANRYVGQLVALQDAESLLEAFVRLDESTKGREAAMFIEGELLRVAGRLDEAAARFEALLGQRSDHVAARVSLVDVLIHQESFERAQALLEPLAGDDRTDVVELRIRLLSSTQRTKDAIELLDELIRRHPTRHGYVLRKSRLQIALRDFEGARATLLNRLNTDPKQESLYDALLELYSTGQFSDWRAQYEMLLARLYQALPNSWLARLKESERLVAVGEAEHVTRAEQLLSALMKERPDDYRALNLYLYLLWQTDRSAKADEIVEGLLAADPHDPALIQAAQAHYSPHRTDNHTRYLELEIQYQLTQPDSDQRATLIGHCYVLLEQPAKAVEVIEARLGAKPQAPLDLIRVLRQAMTQLKQFDQAGERIVAAARRFEKHRADLKLELAFLYEEAERNDLAEKVMLEILDQDPDHVNTNNALGYTWADRGLHLERAERMIRKALKARPDSYAIRDSLGWVFYKQGRFDEAVRELTSAADRPHGDDPIILDHLGDAQYRLGKSDLALQKWTAALAKLELTPHMARLNHETRGLAKRLRGKIEALGRNDEPEVAEIVEPADPAGKKGDPAAHPGDGEQSI